jgi:hypothetical protein
MYSARFVLLSAVSLLPDSAVVLVGSIHRFGFSGSDSAVRIRRSVFTGAIRAPNASREFRMAVPTPEAHSAAVRCLRCAEVIHTPTATATAPDPDCVSITALAPTAGTTCTQHFSLSTVLYVHTRCIQSLYACPSDCAGLVTLGDPVASLNTTPVDYGVSAAGSRFEPVHRQL